MNLRHSLLKMLKKVFVMAWSACSGGFARFLLFFSLHAAFFFRFYSYGLENKFRPQLYEEFQQETIKDYQNGQLYGLEKFWAFLKYYPHSANLQVNPTLKQYLSKFKTIEDFRVVEPQVVIFFE